MNITDYCQKLKSHSRFFLHIIRIAEKLALNFLGGVGKQLHKELVTQDKINRDTNYMAGEVPLSAHTGTACSKS